MQTRLSNEFRAKIKQRAKMNNRSINAEIVATREEPLSRPSPVSGYRDEAEREADIASKEIQALVFARMAEFYRKN